MGSEKQSTDTKEMPNRVVDINSVMERVGSFGKYQKLMTLFLCIPFTFNWSLNYWVHYLILMTPPHHCSVPGVNQSIVPALIPKDVNGQMDSCHRYNVTLPSLEGMDYNETAHYLEVLREENTLGTISCDHGFDFDISADFRTAVVDYQWVCDSQWKKYTTTTMFFLGMLLGLVSFGIMSDKFGRLPVCIITNLLCPFASLICIFCPSFYTFSAARFIMGLTENSVYMMPFILVMEYLPPSARGLVSPLTFSIFPTLVNGSLPWITLWMGSWTSMLLYSSILGLLLVIPASLFMPESASWMLTHDQIERAYATVQKIAKFNGRKLNEKESTEIEDDLYAIKRQIESHPEPCVRQIIRSKKVCLRFLLCVLVSMICNVLYDATIRNLELLPVSSYVTFTLFAATMIPSQIYSGLVMNFFGRKTCIIISLAVSCAMNSVIAFVPLESLSMYFTAALLLTSQMFNVAAFSVLATLMSELLPTVIRARAVSLISCAAAIALTCSPQIIHLGTSMKGLPSIVFATLSLCGVLLTALLPETLGQSLPQTLEDGEALGEDSSIEAEKKKYKENKAQIPEKC